ncbi:hypothetical protein DEI83_12645 [Curtobacterium sp. MCBD17_021]|nr:hypothetical protein DEI83_12645 [Curtobacterium sp. MCBD17_021]
MRPDFAEDPRFTFGWRDMTDDLTPREHEWRSYRRDGEETARLLLVRNYPSHTGDRTVPAVLIADVEVREDLQRTGDHIGTALVDALVADYRDWEIYLGPTERSKGFWNRFGWPKCDCDDCDLIVRRPAS